MSEDEDGHYVLPEEMKKDKKEKQEKQKPDEKEKAVDEILEDISSDKKTIKASKKI